MIRAALLGCLLLIARCALAAVEPAITAQEIAPPVSGTASSSNLVTSPEGEAWLTWIETAADKTLSLKFSRFDVAARKWSPARTIASGPDIYAGTSDIPALTLGSKGRATALWYVKNPPSPQTAHLHHGAGYHAVTSSTQDAGATWSAPARVSKESDINEFAALATLADGRVLAVWLDARVKKIMGAMPDHDKIHPGMKLSQQLYSRIVAPAEAANADAPDTLIEYSVCDCCHTSLAAFPDGTALLVYRGRSEEEARDIRVTRFRGSAWDEPRTLNQDDWRIAGCPVNGPQIVSDGGRAGVAWFTAADNDPRVVASFSPDAGARFLMPLKLSEPKPIGRASIVMLRSTALLVAWIDANGALALRRVTPDYGLNSSVTLTKPEAGRLKGQPRLALVSNYRGGKGGAQVLATFTREGAAAPISTLLIDVPESDFLELGKDCDCAPTPEQLQGYPIRGRIVDLASDSSGVQVRHGEIPGMFAAGMTSFTVAPGTLTEAAKGREFLGRFEKTPTGWRLYDIRLIAAAR